MGNKVDGTALKTFTMEKLAEEYGVSDEDQRKKIYYNLKDILRKDNSSVRRATQRRARCLPSPLRLAAAAVHAAALLHVSATRPPTRGLCGTRRATRTTTRRC